MTRIITPLTLSMMASQVLAPNLTESITLKRSGTTLAAQPCMVRKVSQVQFSEGENISIGGAYVEIIGSVDLDIQQGDKFTWDGSQWEVKEPSIVGTNHVSRKAIAEMRV